MSTKISLVYVFIYVSCALYFVSVTDFCNAFEPFSNKDTPHHRHHKRGSHIPLNGISWKDNKSVRWTNNNNKISCFTPLPFLGKKKLYNNNNNDKEKKDNDNNYFCPRPARGRIESSSTSLSMGLWKQIISFMDRPRDFIRLENSDDEFGPGPLILLYGCPAGIDNDEIRLMIEDGAPIASNRHGKVTLARINTKNDDLLDCTVSDALSRIMAEGERGYTSSDELSLSIPFPVIYFSGISNSEMMQTYNIIAEEIYKETGGAMQSACAKVVEPALTKTLREVMEQISGDHMETLSA